MISIVKRLPQQQYEDIKSLITKSKEDIWKYWDIDNFPLFLASMHIPKKSWNIQKQKFIKHFLQSTLLFQTFQCSAFYLHDKFVAFLLASSSRIIRLMLTIFFNLFYCMRSSYRALLRRGITDVPSVCHWLDSCASLTVLVYLLVSAEYFCCKLQRKTCQICI